ncbi:MAG: phosphoglycolate phosphatase [Azospirillaceae bacterium]|nr:phosphoglycolate phosphatase [Azospirillaceae bacterium]
MVLASPLVAVVFDLDGTLIDSVSDIGTATNLLLARHGRTPLPIERYRDLVGDGSGKLLQYAFAATGAPLPKEQLNDVLDEFLIDYARVPALPACLYPGVVETLDALARAGIRLGVCTNKPERISHKVLAEIGLTGYFGAVCGGDTLTVRKPDPATLRHVLTQLDAPAGAAVMVGDSGNDVALARAAGVAVVAVSYGYPRMPVARLGADQLIDNFAELPRALESLALPA